MQSKSTFLEFLRGIHRYKFGHPKKLFRGEIIQGEWRNFHRARALFLTGVEFHVLPWSWCSSLSSLTISSRSVCFLWTVLPCLLMSTNTIAYAFRCQPRKQLYLIAFVDLVPVATEKVSLYIRSNTVWNRWKSTLSTIHKGEPEPRKGNVNTVYFINQARANTRISRTEFIYDESMRLQMVYYLHLSFLLRIMFAKNILFLQISFYA